MVARFVSVSAGNAKNARPSSRRIADFNRSCLEVRMFNVGSGEAILIVLPDKQAWLVDGGSTNSPLRNEELGGKLARYLKSNKLKLTGLVPSHPHIDHVGAVATLLRARPDFAKKLYYCRSEDATWHGKQWLADLESELDALPVPVEKIVLRNAHNEVTLSPDARAHLFAGSGDQAYTSIFMQLRYRDARLLFTGDAQCPYENDLIDQFGVEDFRADVLKVTHHGSSSGTSKKLVSTAKPGIAIASTAKDDGHQLEKDTLSRLRGSPGHQEILETLISGDIIVQTDGSPQGDGTLYRIDVESPGYCADNNWANVLSKGAVDRLRGDSTKTHKGCG
jgi:competence protein ComEC